MKKIHEIKVYNHGNCMIEGSIISMKIFELFDATYDISIETFILSDWYRQQ